jgi:uncharacterized delta-60 repeat protein
VDTTFAVSDTPFIPLSITKEAIQPDGKIVVVGILQPSEIRPSGFGLARLNTDGSLDTHFGNGGITQIDFAGHGIILQPDGKILVAGDADSSGLWGTAFALARYNPDGTLDTRFGQGGEVLTTFPREQVGGGASQADGKIVVVGSTPSSERSGDNTFTVVRYTSDGALDPSFGSGGVVTTDFGGDDEAYGVAIQYDGKIVATGSSVHHTIVPCSPNTPRSIVMPDGSVRKVAPYDGLTTILQDGTFATARYNADGSLDDGFGTGGTVLTRFDSQETQTDFGLDNADAVVVQADGKLLVGGVAAGRFALTRYNPDGTTDQSFGTDGRTTTLFSYTSTFLENPDGVHYILDSWTQWAFYTAIAGIALQPDGKFVVAASDHTLDLSSPLDLALARYNPDGTLDCSFGTAGKTNTYAGGCLAGVSSIALEPDGKVVVTAASLATRGPSRMVMLRFLGDTPSSLQAPGVETDRLPAKITGPDAYPPASYPPSFEGTAVLAPESPLGINAITQGVHQSSADETGKVHWTVGGGTLSARTTSVRGPDARVMLEPVPTTSSVPSLMGPTNPLADRAPSPTFPAYLHPGTEVRVPASVSPGSEISVPSYLPQPDEVRAARSPLPVPAYLAVVERTASTHVPIPATFSVGVTPGNASMSAATAFQPRLDFGPGTPVGGDGKTRDHGASSPSEEKPSDEETRGQGSSPSDPVALALMAAAIPAEERAVGQERIPTRFLPSTEEEPAPVLGSLGSIAAPEAAQPLSAGYWPYLLGLACGVLLILAEPTRLAREAPPPRWPRPL